MKKVHRFSALSLSDIVKALYSASANAKMLLKQDFQKWAACFQSYIVLRGLGFIYLLNDSNKIRTHLYLCTSQEVSLTSLLLKPCLLACGSFIVVTAIFLSSVAHSGTTVCFCVYSLGTNRSTFAFRFGTG